MRATGIVRRIDALGRVVLPVELRRALDLGKEDGLEIAIDGEDIVLVKHVPRCIFCGQERDLTAFRDRLVCTDCLAAIAALAP